MSCQTALWYWGGVVGFVSKLMGMVTFGGVYLAEGDRLTVN